MKNSKKMIKNICCNLTCAKNKNNINEIVKNATIFMQKMERKVENSNKHKIATKKDKKFSKKEKLMLLAGGSVIGFLNGFFGGGGGMVRVPILQKVLSLDAKKSHATAIAVIFPLSLISAFIYVINGYIKSFPLLTIGLGVVVGGILGSFALKFLPPKAIRLIFAVIMFVGGIKLII